LGQPRTRKSHTTLVRAKCGSKKSCEIAAQDRLIAKHKADLERGIVTWVLTEKGQRLLDEAEATEAEVADAE
jgi:hypothetical protein